MARTKDFDESEVLKKAVCIFWDKGYNGTSMQELVDGLGISRSSLYDTFGDKHQLYLKALESYKNQHNNHFCTITTTAASAKEAVRQLLESVVKELLNDDQRKGCFTVNAGVEMGMRDQAVKDLLCGVENQFQDLFLKIIEKGQKSGEISKDKDPVALARFLGNTIRGIQVSVKSINDSGFFQDIIKTALLVL